MVFAQSQQLAMIISKLSQLKQSQLTHAKVFVKNAESALMQNAKMKLVQKSAKVTKWKKQSRFTTTTVTTGKVFMLTHGQMKKMVVLHTILEIGQEHLLQQRIPKQVGTALKFPLMP